MFYQKFPHDNLNTLEVNTKPLVGVSTTKSLFKEDTESFCFSTHEKDIKEWVAPKSNSTSKGIPLIKHLPWIRSLDFKASASLRVKTLPVAFGCPVWSFRHPPLCSFLGYGQSL